MSLADTTDGDHLDSVIIEPREGTHVTLTEKLSYRVDGFHWQFCTPKTKRLPPLYGSRASGSYDGDVVLRGIIEDVSTRRDGTAEVFVGPPHAHEID
jgi:hypothetical protein